MEKRLIRRRIDHYRTWYWVVALFFFCLFCFIVMAYGGVRSPDGENIFWVAESLARSGSFEVNAQFPTWKNFMLARGVNGKLYSSFAPGQAVLLAPLIKLAIHLNATGWYEAVPLPISFINAAEMKSFVLGGEIGDPAPHALRFIASAFNLIVSGMLVVVFFFLVRRMTASKVGDLGSPSMAAFAAALLLALATPLWSYSGTMFKEPLTITCVLLSFFNLAGNDSRSTGGPPERHRIYLAGLFAGLALTVHITAVFFIPFLFVYALYPYSVCVPEKGSICFKKKVRQGGKTAVVFGAGLAIPAGMLACYNYTRFGSIIETGRSLKAGLSLQYGSWCAPWEGLLGFLISPGKGIVWFAPILFAGLFCWSEFHRKNRFLSGLIIIMIVFRIVIIACRSDWHGGFCLGPRHLLPVLPFFIIPIGYWFFRLSQKQAALSRIGASGVVLFFWACVSQQIYFCIGEPVSFYYFWKHYFLQKGVSVIAGNGLYFNWDTSPVLYLLEGKRGPFLLQHIPWSNYVLWGLGTLAAGVLLGGLGGAVMICKRRRLMNSDRGA